MSNRALVVVVGAILLFAFLASRKSTGAAPQPYYKPGELNDVYL